MFRFLSNVTTQITTYGKISAQLPVRLASPFDSLPKLLAPQLALNEQVRSIIKFSRGDGRKKTEREVPHRFFRLHWGGWIRTKAGRAKHMWKRSVSNRRRLRQHVLCNNTQCKLLDRMVCEFWRRPKYYIEDPYAPYHTREEFSITRRKPWRPQGWE